MNFENERDMFSVEIPLSFKLPISLNLQRKDQQNLENEDYRYLKELLSETNEREYEIVIERHKFPKFFSDFYGTVLELTKEESDLFPLAVFEELKMDLFLSNLQREHYVRGDAEPAEVAFPEDESLMSILKIKVSPKNTNDFILLFREFARRNLISTESDWETDEQSREYEQQMAEYEKNYERRLEYTQLLEHGKEYAKLNCLLMNIKRKHLNPYVFEEEDYQKFYNEYLSDFKDRFTDLINQEESSSKGETPDNDVVTEKIRNINNEKLRGNLIKQLEDIKDQIEVNPNFALNPMRVTLEGVIKEVCIKENIPILEETNKRPRRLMALKRELELNELSKEISHLINMGNTGSHYDILHSFISVDTKEAEELFHILIRCIEFIIEKFEL